MSELDEIKKRKLEELKNNSMGQAEEEAKIHQQLEALENMVRGCLTKEARERYGNIKAAYPEKTAQVLLILGQAIQEGRAKTIDDEMLKIVLKQITPKKKEFKIIRK
ncbi:MAG: hypothetical protein GY861_23005 [bacterium]|nr:hypothetical protein [bacterium]